MKGEINECRKEKDCKKKQNEFRYGIGRIQAWSYPAGTRERSFRKVQNVLNIAGLDKAVDLFWSMIDSPVYVYCDYDCDGITSGSIISIGCNSIGIKPHIIIPRRFTDGYGIKIKNLENMDPSGLLITVDNGIAANEAVDTAKERV